VLAAAQCIFSQNCGPWALCWREICFARALNCELWQYVANLVQTATGRANIAWLTELYEWILIKWQQNSCTIILVWNCKWIATWMWSINWIWEMIPGKWDASSATSNAKYYNVVPSPVSLRHWTSPTPRYCQQDKVLPTLTTSLCEAHNWLWN